MTRTCFTSSVRSWRATLWSSATAAGARQSLYPPTPSSRCVVAEQLRRVRVVAWGVPAPLTARPTSHFARLGRARSGEILKRHEFEAKKVAAEEQRQAKLNPKPKKLASADKDLSGYPLLQALEQRERLVRLSPSVPAHGRQPDVLAARPLMRGKRIAACASQRRLAPRCAAGEGGAFHGLLGLASTRRAAQALHAVAGGQGSSGSQFCWALARTFVCVFGDRSVYGRFHAALLIGRAFPPVGA